MEYSEYLLNKRDYQEEGHLLLLERKHACLFYKPGKGKTYPCIDAIRDIDASKPNGAKVLILSTADAIKSMWLAEIVPQDILPIGTVLMSFNSAIVEATKAKLLKIKWDIIVIDESHKIKSHNSKISKLVYQLSKKAEYCFGLTGTPRGNSDVDIYCQFHNMNISDWGHITYTNFVEQCCDIEQKFFGGHMIKIPIGINHRYRAGWERNIAMYSQRVEYDELDEMPELDVDVVRLDYTPTERYLQAEDGIISTPDYETTMTKLAAIQKAHQAANGYLYVPSECDLDKKVVYRFEHNKKVDWLLENVKVDEPTVIVYRFQADYDYIVEHFAPNAYTENIADFKDGKANILMLQCARCESFNLQMCSKIIFFTLDYSYIKYNQMIHRVWRKGQKNDVQIKILVFKDTIEERIWRTVQNKEKLADLFMSYKGV